MDPESFQDRVRNVTESWPRPKPEFLFMLLAEELGELIHVSRRSQGKRWGLEDEPVGSKTEVTEELGDVLFLRGRVALYHSVDLGDAADGVVKKIESREGS